MKRLFTFICCLFLFFNLSSIVMAQKNKNITLNVYNWGEYISNGTDGFLDVNAEFTQRTGIKINYKTFPSNESLFATLLSGGTDCDVFIPSDYMVARLREKNMLRKLDFNNIPNFRHIDKEFLNREFDPTNEYSVPYTWGTVGIFYNKKMVSEPEDKINWDMLWNEKYAGNILMFDNPRDAFAIAQFKLGIPLNTKDPENWHKAAQELDKQKPLIQSYVMDQIFDKMGNNEAALAPYYAGDAANLLKRNPDLGFVIPKTGTNMFIDAMCIPVNSKNPQAAEAYINFMCEPEIAAQNIEYISYSTPESVVKNLLPKEMAENKIMYPEAETLAKTQVFTNLPEEINTLLDELWTKIKTGEGGSSAMLVAVVVFFGLVYIISFLYKRNKKFIE